MKASRHISAIALIIAIPLIGTAIMFGFIYALPQAEGNIGANVIYALVLIVLGLAIPYFMAKSVLFEARQLNPREKQFSFSDIAKDKDELAHKMKANK